MTGASNSCFTTARGRLGKCYWPCFTDEWLRDGKCLAQGHSDLKGSGVHLIPRLVSLARGQMRKAARVGAAFPPGGARRGDVILLPSPSLRGGADQDHRLRWFLAPRGAPAWAMWLSAFRARRGPQGVVLRMAAVGEMRLGSRSFRGGRGAGGVGQRNGVWGGAASRLGGGPGAHRAGHHASLGSSHPRSRLSRRLP